jgi:hypothetical protein
MVVLLPEDLSDGVTLRMVRIGGGCSVKTLSTVVARAILGYSTIHAAAGRDKIVVAWRGFSNSSSRAYYQVFGSNVCD